MNLRQFIASLPSFSPHDFLYLEDGKPFSADSETSLVEIPEDAEDDPEIPGMCCIMSVRQVREVVEGKATVAGLVEPSLEQRIALFLEYLENGA